MRRGLIKRRRTLPTVVYILAVVISMSGAAGLATLQAKTRALAAPTAKIATTPKTVVHIVPRLPESAPTLSLSEQDAQLQSIINQFVDGHSSYRWSVVLQGLNGDERAASYKPSQSFVSASIYKLLLMYPLSQKTPIDKWSSVRLNASGGSRSLADCVSAMLKVSDNPCGVAVGEYVGWAYADEQLKLIGLKHTNLNNAQGQFTTAADLNVYLQKLYGGRLFDVKTRSFILNTLDLQILRGGIPAGCGSSCSVADKTGDLGFVRHDAGVVRYAGGAYSLSIFSSGANYELIAQLAQQLQNYLASNSVN